jgi:hypothetical protein
MTEENSSNRGLNAHEPKNRNGEDESGKCHPAHDSPPESPEKNEKEVIEEINSNGGLNTHQPENKHRASESIGYGTEARGRGKGSWAGIIALIIAVIALVIALQEKFSSRYDALDSINQMITDTLVPGVNKATERDVIGHIYDLKRVMITLEEIKEASENEDVKAMVDKLRKDIEELNVKLFVHE